MTALDELARRFQIPQAGVDALRAVLDLQAEDPAASTAVRDPAAAVDRHVADSLVALDLLAVNSATRIADLGSGAGWPGLALAAALPAAHVALVESAARHCRYLERAVAASRLDNVTIVHARAEEWADGRDAHDLVTARAVASLPVLVEYAAPLLTRGGSLVAWKATVDEPEATAGDTAAGALGLEPVEVLPVAPYPDAGLRALHVFRKVAPTPPGYPRRPGMAAKRPLGGGSGRAAR